MKLTHNSISKENINSLCFWLKSTNQLTQGKVVEEFENKFSKYIGSNYSIFVNSGSSANLLGLYGLKLQYPNIKDLIFPPLCWATNPAPAYMLGYDLHTCDVNYNNLSFDIEKLEKQLKILDRPAIIMVVSVLGLQPFIADLLKLCDQYGCVLFEDVCEGLGSTYYGKKLGTFGKLGTFSFYHSHHISCIEGGMIITDDYNLYKILLSCRSHGWMRNNPDAKIKYSGYKIDQTNQQFTFFYPGFNLRSTEINAYLGILQLTKVENFITQRFENFNTYYNRLNKYLWVPSKLDDEVVSNFGWPIIVKYRDKLVKILKQNNIEYRPLISGSILEHPVNQNYYKLNIDCSKARYIHEHGVYIPNHQEITTKQINNICDILIDEHRNLN